MIKPSVTYQQKWAYSGTAENYNSGYTSYSKSIGKPGEHRQGMFIIEEKGGLGGAVINQKLTGVNWEFQE